MKDTLDKSYYNQYEAFALEDIAFLRDFEKSVQSILLAQKQLGYPMRQTAQLLVQSVLIVESEEVLRFATQQARSSNLRKDQNS